MIWFFSDLESMQNKDKIKLRHSYIGNEHQQNSIEKGKII